ncbi:MAG TPA: hypothetical protein VK158_04465 [Acidobacteriota bacterium]|nr:hypothetical protein [Acidobacteriota bacterium]
MRYIALICIILFALAGCAPTPVICDENTSSCDNGSFIPPTMNVSNISNNASVVVNSNTDLSTDKPAILAAATFKEGDLIKLRKNLAADPDGDRISYAYSKPFSRDGTWQTQIGDAGLYNVTITATDGKLTTIRNVIIEVISINKAPIITVKDITVDEGDVIELSPVIVDPENDTVTVTISGWMNSTSYRSTFDDAGSHKVTIRATDGTLSSEETVDVTVNNVNRKPQILGFEDITITEGEELILNAQVIDPDGDQIKINFSKPVLSSGTWQTRKGDAGKYDITLSASDGEFVVSKSIQATIKSANVAPKISDLSDVTVNETQTVVLTPIVTDANGDKVSVSYSGWMTSPTKTTTYGDAGVYEVTVSATDGTEATSQDVKVTVLKVNRAPQFVDDADLFD